MNRKDHLAVALLLLLLLAAYLFPFLSGRVLSSDPAMEDVSFNIMPNFYWVGESYRQGEFPLWNPHTSAGMPHLAYTHCGGLYPLNVLLLTFLPYLPAASLIILLHGLLVAILLYAILRSYQAPPFLAAAGALIYTLSGLYFRLNWQLWMSASGPGFLALWLACKNFLARPRWTSFLLGALAVAWCGLAGDTELVSYAVIALYFIAFFAPETGWRPRSKNVIYITFILAAGILLLTPLALPTLELQHLSLRGPHFPLPLQFDVMNTVIFLNLPTWVFPFQYFGQLYPVISFHSAMSYGYQGFLMPWLIIWGLAASFRSPGFRPLAAAWSVLFAYIILREQEATTHLFDVIPILGSLHFSFKSLVAVHALSVVMGFRVLSVIPAENENGRGGRMLALVFLAGGILVMVMQPLCLGGAERYAIGATSAGIGGLMLLRRRGKPVLSVRQGILLAAVLWALEVYLLAWSAMPAANPRRFQLSPAVDRFAHTLSPETRYAVFETLLSESPQAEVPIFGLFEVASGACNLVGPSRIVPVRHFWFISRLYRKLIVEEGRKFFYYPRAITDPGALDRGRLHLLHLAGVKVLLSRGLPLPFSSPYSLQHPLATDWKVVTRPTEKTIPSSPYLSTPIQVTSPLSPLPEDRLRLNLKNQFPGRGMWLHVTVEALDGSSRRLLFVRFNSEPRLEKEVDLTPLAGERRILSLSLLSPGPKPAGFQLQELEIVNPTRPFQKQGQEGSVSWFANQAALPRAFVAHAPVVIKDWKQIAEWMNDRGKFEPDWQVVVEEETPEVSVLRKLFPGPRLALPPEKVEIRRYSSQRVEMEAKLLRPGFLVFSDTFFPGWRAFVETGTEKQELRILPADLAFRAVFLPEGNHRLTWLYLPRSFEIGLWVGLTSLAVLLLRLAARPTRRPSSSQISS